MDAELFKQSERYHGLMVDAKKRLLEMVLSEGAFDHAEVDRLRHVYFSNRGEYRRITEQLEAQRQAEIRARQELRAARRLEAQEMTKDALIVAVGYQEDRKRITRERLIMMYETMKG